MSTTKTQWSDALQVGTQIRLAVLAARRRVAEHPDTEQGFRALAEEIEARERWSRQLKVDEVLRWPRYSMPWQRANLLSLIGASEQTLLEGLTDRQLGLLLRGLRDPEVWTGRRFVGLHAGWHGRGMRQDGGPHGD